MISCERWPISALGQGEEQGRWAATGSSAGREWDSLVGFRRLRPRPRRVAEECYSQTAASEGRNDLGYGPRAPERQLRTTLLMTLSKKTSESPMDKEAKLNPRTSTLVS